MQDSWQEFQDVLHWEGFAPLTLLSHKQKTRRHQKEATLKLLNTPEVTLSFFGKRWTHEATF